jgi:hypothetical protein
MASGVESSKKLTTRCHAITLEDYCVVSELAVNKGDSENRLGVTAWTCG